MQNTSPRNAIKDFCKLYFKNKLVIQGSGGNISWKERDILWVKASGTSIKDIEKEDIFVPVDLKKLILNINNNDYQHKPESQKKDGSRPSIETIMHAVMPHQFVAHFHDVDVLSTLISNVDLYSIKNKIGSYLNYQFLDYVEPGPELANKIHTRLLEKPDTEFFFLQNHGILFGANSIDRMYEIMKFIRRKFKLKPLKIENDIIINASSGFKIQGYSFSKNREINLLSHKSGFLDAVKNLWAICPDHVLFLGAIPIVLEKNTTINEIIHNFPAPPFIFIENVGVLQSKSATPNQVDQLKFYLNCVSRVRDFDNVKTLTKSQVEAILLREDEKYRFNLKLRK